MGKAAAAAAEAKKTRKKGRPSLSDLRMRNLNNSNKKPTISISDLDSSPNLGHRSTLRNPNSAYQSSDYDDEHRQKKKIKLVVRLPASNSSEINASPDRSDADDDELVVKDEKVTEVPQGSPFESSPIVPLPDKKLLEFILDRLQKKDTHRVFSEPVDPNELPDYFEIIEHPMDFGTVRNKLNEGSYSKLDDFESDVLLICRNAMQYNSPDTVFYRQAKSIQEIAKRDFENLRQVNDEGEPQPKIVRRGRPSNLLKALTSPPLERVAPESSSDATLATAGENDNKINNNNNNNSNNNIINNNAIGSNSYTLRKGVSKDAVFKDSPQSRNSETYADYTTDWNSEFPGKILKAEAKHAKKQFTADENRRLTYKQFHPSAFGHDSSSLITLNRNKKQLIGVGLQSEHGYARSLARFAANLGPVAWKIASKKIERALPGGVNFGPGWVGENETLPSHTQTFITSHNSAHDNSTHHQAGSSSGLRNSVSNMGSVTVLEAQQKHKRNGFNNQFSAPAEMVRARLNLPTGQQSDHQEGNPTAQIVPPQQQKLYNGVIPVHPDLNVRFQAPGSPNSNFDLALQL